MPAGLGSSAYNQLRLRMVVTEPLSLGKQSFGAHHVKRKLGGCSEDNSRMDVVGQNGFLSKAQDDASTTITHQWCWR